MAYTAIDDPGIFFKANLHSGNGTAIGSGGNAITGIGFQPDMTWLKSRSYAYCHGVLDSLRGATKIIYPNASWAEDAEGTPESLTTWGADGFTVGSHNDANASGQTYVSWNWIANGTGSSNTAGSINTTATSANTTSGFSIITYTGNDTAGATIGHSLGAVPHFILVRCRSAAQSWCVYHHKNTSAPETDFLNLDTTAQTDDNVNRWADTAPTSTLISLGDENQTNGALTYVAYAWTEKQGYSKFGTYTGNGNADGTYVYTGFRPAFVVTKQSSGTGTNGWYMFDDKRAGYNPDNEDLLANTCAAEDTTNNHIDIYSNGFKIRITGNHINEAGGTYVYMAFAEAPFVNSEGVPCNAR